MQYLPVIRRESANNVARSTLLYHRAVFSHVVQIAPVALGFAALLVTLNGFVGLLALAIAEVAVVVLAPRSARFRRSIDQRIVRRRQREAANARLFLLAEMNPLHAKELVEIERLAWETRDRASLSLPASSSAASSSATEMIVDRSLTIEKLVAAYVRLAIAQRNRRCTFSAERRKQLDLEVAAMAIASATAPANDEWTARRRAILELREATWRTAADEDRMITEALATIANIVRWVHEVHSTSLAEGGSSFFSSSSSSSSSSASPPSDVDRVLEGCLRPLTFAEEMQPYIDTSFLELPPPVMAPSAVACAVRA
jgi:hypothetical protein